MGDGDGGLGGDLGGIVDPALDEDLDNASHVVVDQRPDHGIIWDGSSPEFVLPPPVRVAHPPEPVPEPDDDEDD